MHLINCQAPDVLQYLLHFHMETLVKKKHLHLSVASPCQYVNHNHQLFWTFIFIWCEQLLFCIFASDCQAPDVLQYMLFLHRAILMTLAKNQCFAQSLLATIKSFRFTPVLGYFVHRSPLRKTLPRILGMVVINGD